MGAVSLGALIVAGTEAGPRPGARGSASKNKANPTTTALIAPKSRKVAFSQKLVGGRSTSFSIPLAYRVGLLKT